MSFTGIERKADKEEGKKSKKPNTEEQRPWVRQGKANLRLGELLRRGEGRLRPGKDKDPRMQLAGEEDLRRREGSPF